MAAFPCLFAGCSCGCTPATWRTRGSKAQEENAGRGINGGDPIAPLGAIGVAAVYAAKARILFLRRARAQPSATLPRQRRNKRVRDRRGRAETLLRLRSQEPGAEGPPARSPRRRA